jgi:hypothetical protein
VSLGRYTLRVSLGPKWKNPIPQFVFPRVAILIGIVDMLPVGGRPSCIGEQT